MKNDPKYGYYPWWPENGDHWLHPEDVELARQLIPSLRVFCRDGEQGSFVVLYYGNIKLRVRRTLWQEVETDGYELGDWVEVLSRGMQNTPRTGVIREMVWDTRNRCLQYQLSENNQPIADFYTAIDLRPVEPADAKLET